MKSIAPAALAALDRGDAIVSGAAEILGDEPLRLWSGYGQITLGGNVFEPLGDRRVAIATGAMIGGTAQNLSLTLSGVEPALLPLLDAAEVREAPVVVWSLIFDSSGTIMLDAFVSRRGRVDRLPVRETSGGSATITVEVEGPGRGLGRRTGRLRSDADQRLIKATDGSMRLISYAAEKTLYWGGQKATRAGSALPQ